MAEQRHPRLWPLSLAGWKSTKHQDNGSSLPSPQLALVSLALKPVRPACPPISSWGWAGSSLELFQHHLGVVTDPQRGTRLGVRLHGSETQKVAGSRAGRAHEWRFSSWKGEPCLGPWREGGSMPGNPPQAPRVGRSPHPIAQMGRLRPRESMKWPKACLHSRAALVFLLGPHLPGGEHG